MAFKRFTASSSQLKGDPRYNSRLCSKFINCLMLDGKKSVAQRLFYDAMDIIASKVKDAPPNEVFEKALENIKPAVEVRSKRVGGANYQVPMQVGQRRRQSLAIRWVLEATRGKRGSGEMAKRLADELMMAFRGEGDSIKKREDVHRMADANKAFAHYAW
ncbi:MAG: 30S ribosomal protein S7 [Planctomycetia bacterium]|nr:MAG: 30S ribosomal protein S7 [Planctomycetia bacterium]